MNRVLPAIAVGALLAIVVFGVIVALQPASIPTASERADALASELRCPDCQGLSVADSPTGAAREIRRQVGEMVAGGATDVDVRAHFVARYGEWILLAPSAPIVWLVPFVAIVVAAAALVAWLIRRRPTEAGPAAVLTDADRRRLHDEAEALDA